MTFKKLNVVLVALLSVATAQAQTDSDRTTVYVNTVLGSFSIELLDDVSPNTVANFLNYVRDGDYDGTFFHRAIPGFILQGGGFSMGTDGQVSEVPSDPPVANEFRLSNIRGTIAMAKVGGNPNSATNQWFVNLADNSANLDAQNGGFTVFARVIGDGMDIVDAIVAQPISNFGGVFSDTPTIDYFSGAVSREHLVNINSMTVIESTLTSTGIASPASAPAGTSVLFTVTVTPGTNPASTGITVTADLSSIGGSAAQTLFDDGTNGDVVSGDNVFSFLATVGSGTSSGAHSITVNVSDSISRTGTTSLALTVSPGQTFSIPDGGGISLISQGTSPALRVGYGQVETDNGMAPPAGLAIFSSRVNGILVSEAGVPAVPPVLEGRIFAETGGAVRTGLAMANPNDTAATIAFFFTNSGGIDSGHGTFALGPREQIARFLDEEPFNGGSAIEGTFTFTADLPVAGIALRGFVNERSEFLMTTLPVAPLSAGAAGTVYFPHFAAGGGWTTQVILVNPTDAPISGSAQFFGSGSETEAAAPATQTLDDGRSGSEFPYAIPPRSATRFRTSDPAGPLEAGSVRAVPDTGQTAPAGVSIFSFHKDGATVSEAGVPASTSGRAFRVYVEASGTPGQPGSVRSGIALTNTSDAPVRVSLELTGLGGTATGSTESLTIPASGHIARFIDEFFPTLTPPFSGILRIAATAPDIAAVGLRLAINQRHDILVTTTPPVDENAAPIASDLFFPHFVDSGGWTTQFILFSDSSGQTASGVIRFTGQDGQPLELSVAPTAAPTIR